MIKAIILEGCPPSNHVKDLLHNNEMCIVRKVSYKDKDIVKNNLNIKTFPQLYFEDGNKMYSLGGKDELMQLLNNNNEPIQDISKPVQQKIQAIIESIKLQNGKLF